MSHTSRNEHNAAILKDKERESYFQLQHHAPKVWALVNDGRVGFPLRNTKALELITFLEHAKPKNILDLGSGISTFIFTLYANKYGAKVTTIEESDEWIEKVKGWLTPFKEQPTFVKSGVMLDDEHHSLRYDADININGPYDLVFVDGPNNNTHEKYPCIDIFYLHMAPKYILFDIRVATVKVFSVSKLGSFYDQAKSMWHFSETGYVSPNSQHFTIASIRADVFDIAEEKPNE